MGIIPKIDRTTLRFVISSIGFNILNSASKDSIDILSSTKERSSEGASRVF